MHGFCAYRKATPTPQRVVEKSGSSIEMNVWLNDQRGVVMKIFKAVLVGSLIAFSGLAAAQNCPYDPRCISNPYGAGNPYGPIMNPYAPDSTSNPYGRYGNPYSPDSLNNPYGAGNPYNPGLIYVVPVK